VLNAPAPVIDHRGHPAAQGRPTVLVAPHLEPAEFLRLHRAIREVLAKATKLGGSAGTCDTGASPEST